jgi:Zn-dependent protease
VHAFYVFAPYQLGGSVALATGQSITAVIAGVAFILVAFLCVVLHEFGHALTAKRYGIRTRDIILLPVGGVARLQSVVIAVGLFIGLKVTASFEPMQMLTVTTGPFIERIMAVNLFLAAFNLLPAFPMDGGRVLRAVLATRKEYSRATQIAASIGQGMAVFFGFIGLFYNPLLLFIAFFVWIGAAQEASMAQMQSVVGGIPIQHAMLTDFRTLHKNDSLDHAIEMTLAGSQRTFRWWIMVGSKAF